MSFRLRKNRTAWFPLALLALFAGCTETPTRVDTADAETSGRPLGGTGFTGEIRLGTTPELAAIVREQADGFHRLYPNATIEVVESTARAAIVGVLRGELEAAIVDRTMNEEELDVADEYEITVGQTLVAEGAVLAVVPEESPVQSIPLEAVRKLLSGDPVRWESVVPGVPGEARLVLTDRNAGTVEYITRRLLPEGALPQSAIRASSEPDVLTRVAGRSDAVGLVSALTLRTDTTARVRTVALIDSIGRPVQPSQRSVYLDEYPLRQPIVLVTRAERGGLGAGFATFLLDTVAQEVILRAGLVPARPPVREFNLNLESASAGG